MSTIELDAHAAPASVKLDAARLAWEHRRVRAAALLARRERLAEAIAVLVDVVAVTRAASPLCAALASRELARCLEAAAAYDGASAALRDAAALFERCGAIAAASKARLARADLAASKAARYLTGRRATRLAPEAYARRLSCLFVEAEAAFEAVHAFAVPRDVARAREGLAALGALRVHTSAVPHVRELRMAA